MHTPLLLRIALGTVGLGLAIQRFWRIRSDAWSDAPTTLIPRLRRADLVLGIGAACGVLGIILLPLRIELEWPHWLFFPFFGLLLCAIGFVFYGAILLGIAMAKRTVSDRDQSPNVR